MDGKIGLIRQRCVYGRVKIGVSLTAKLKVILKRKRRLCIRTRNCGGEHLPAAPHRLRKPTFRMSHMTIPENRFNDRFGNLQPERKVAAWMECQGGGVARFVVCPDAWNRNERNSVDACIRNIRAG